MQRLKTRAQFQAVMAGSTVSRTAHFALHRVQLEAPAGTESMGLRSAGPKALFVVHEPSIGVLVPKRWARRAVTRNAIKRQIYHVSQVFESRLRAAPHVVRLRAAFDRKQFISATSEALKQAVRGELTALFGQAAA